LASLVTRLAATVKGSEGEVKWEDGVAMSPHFKPILLNHPITPIFNILQGSPLVLYDEGLQ
jgi:hypothetical protein